MDDDNGDGGRDDDNGNGDDDEDGGDDDGNDNDDFTAPGCGGGEFSCQGGGCVPQRWTCDAEEVRMT